MEKIVFFLKGQGVLNGLYVTTGMFFAYIGVEPPIICVVVLLMVFDTITGISKAIRLKEYKSSTLVRRLISKIFVLTTIILLALSLRVFGGYVSEVGSIAISGVIGVLGFAELTSIIQNVSVVRTGEKIEEWDAVGYALKSLHSKIKSIIERLLNK